MRKHSALGECKIQAAVPIPVVSPLVDAPTAGTRAVLAKTRAPIKRAFAASRAISCRSERCCRMTHIRFSHGEDLILVGESVSNQRFIVLDIVLGHPFCTEALLEPATDRSTVNILDPLDSLHGFRFVHYDKTCNSI